MHKLQALAKEADLTITNEQARQFLVYRSLLLEWNEKMNLTGITDPEAINIKHFIDSLLVLHKDWIPQGAQVVDVGSGAGFPGLPLAIVREDLQLTYADSLKKRLGFLDEVIRKIDIKQNKTVHGRAEDLGRNKIYREQFSVAVARAVASMDVLLEYTLPFVKPSGCMIAWKGPNATEEITAAEAAAEKLGAAIGEVYKIEVLGMERLLVRVDKRKPTPARYPRRPAAIQKKPL